VHVFKILNMKNLVLSFICILCVVSCGKYEDEYIEVNLFPEYTWVDVVDSSTTAFVSRYWNTTHHCFNNTFDGEVSMYDYWPEAHGLDVLIDAYLRTDDDKYKDDIYDFFDGVRGKNSSISNWKADYYDDMGWHGLAHMRAFEATGDVRYEESAEDLWTWITEGWSKTEGGGIQWRTTSDELGESKGLPANGPACIIAARRAQLYPDEVVGGFTDLEWGLRIYDWMKYNRTVLSTGRVYEVYSSTNGDYSYDAGTFIGSALELYKITGDKVYFNDAIKTADYHISSNVYRC
jgi:predicted alpha-1,6-mannanase (GH76 family)